MKRNSKTTKTKALGAILGLLLLAGCAQEINPSQSTIKSDDSVSANVIYGTDGRLDLYQVTDDRLKVLADSTVALVKNSSLTLNGSVYSIATKNFGSSMNLCASEKFREQDTAAFCSGALVGEDLILTAGHCIETASDCASTSFVFGFGVKQQGVLPKTAGASEVYKCREIIKTVKKAAGADFAVIKLDRPVTGHKVLKYRATGDVDASASLVVIGHPVGLPTKVTTGGSVRSTTPAEHFVTNLDTYGGNSGSSVFNLETGLIEGVLVRGEQDFVSQGGCTVSKVCTDSSCRGEDVTKISVVREFLPKVTDPVTPPPPVDPPPVLAEKFESKVAVSIPDNNKQGISSALQVGSVPNGRKVIVNLNIKHTFIGDLSVQLVSPSGQVATLHHRAGGSTDDIVKSIEVTSSLGKVAVAGEYKLLVQDLAKLDVGQVVSWSLEFK